MKNRGEVIRASVVPVLSVLQKSTRAIKEEIGIENCRVMGDILQVYDATRVFYLIKHQELASRNRTMKYDKKTKTWKIDATKFHKEFGDRIFQSGWRILC